MSDEFRLEQHTLLSRNPDQVSAELEGETVLMSIETGRYYGMDSIGSRIWKLLEKPISWENLKTSILSEFEGDSSQIERDMQTFLQELYDEQLILLQ